jgi:hypothetical protein
MRLGEPLGKRNVDRAHGNVNCGGEERAEYAVGAEGGTLDRGIVGEHGDDHVALCCLRRSLRQSCALAASARALAGLRL